MAKVEKLQIEYVDLKELKLASYNPRKFDSRQFQKIKDSISTYGMKEALIVNKRNNVILHGNQRYKALVALNHKEAPVTWVDLDEAEEKVFNIVMNAVGMSFDEEKLAYLVESIKNQTSMQLLLQEMIEQKKKDLKDKGITPEMEFSKEVDEKFNYIVVVFDKVTDFMNVQTMFNMNPVYDAVKGKKVGMGRIIDGKEFIKKLK